MAAKSAAALFLDTLPFNGHSTVVEALWEALPVVTLPGTRMAGRVAASLLAAAGLEDLFVARTQSEYSDLAARLLSGRGRGQVLLDARRRLARERAGSQLWDTTTWVRGFESGLLSLWDVHASGRGPMHLSIL
jgi:protein O-GlcNAc transferase